MSESLEYIRKTYNNYQIELKQEKDSLRISMYNNQVFYEANFTTNYLQNKFEKRVPIKEIINEISRLINERKIEIEGNKLILKRNQGNIELTLGESFQTITKLEEKIKLIGIISLSIIIILFILFILILSYLFNKKIKDLENFKIKEINERISYLEKDNLNFNNIINLESKFKGFNESLIKLEEENVKINNKINLENSKIKEINERIINLVEENVNINNKINLENSKNKEINERVIDLEEIKINERINYLEKDNVNINSIINEFVLNQNQNLTKINLTNTNTIQKHSSSVQSASIFPSGNIVSVSNDKSIIIYDNLFNVLQIISDAHSQEIYYVEIKDENNFVTCSKDKTIKTWIKRNNKFEINKTINDAHDSDIIKVIYNSKGNLISCSLDYSIKIWEEKNGEYINIKTLSHSKYIFTLLLLEDKNLLVSSGADGTIFWDLNNNYQKIIFNDTYCEWNHGIERIGNDRIIVQDNSTFNLKIFSISQKKIIVQIENDFESNAINNFENKGIFFVGGEKDIKIFRNDNYELIQTIRNAHMDWINGFIELKNGSIASFADDYTMKIWSY